jgi:two-component system nitrate/nitrite sensor histidine kinase NarX
MSEPRNPSETAWRVAHPTQAGPGILAEITAGLAAGSDLHVLLGRFLDPIIQIAGAQAGAVRVLDGQESRMHLVGDRGLPRIVLDAEQSVEHDCGVCGAAVQFDRPVWADDLSSCSRRTEGVFFGSGCTRVLAVPLHHKGQTLGVYNLFYEGGREPGPDVLALLKSVGDLLGLALENARLQRENLQATVASERQMMAAEVHDSIAQSLAYVKMRLPLLHDAMLARDDERARKYFGDVRQAVGDAHTSLRQILADFRTSVDPQGLLHALRGVAAVFEDRTGIAFELVERCGELPLAPERQAQAFHVVQEALANVARHSRAEHASVTVELAGAKVHLRIEDDGQGVHDLPAAHTPSHYGIDIMKARARRLGGSLELRARAGGGTCVSLEFPLHAPAQHNRAQAHGQP